MSFPHSLLFRLSTWVQLISPSLLWLLLLMRVDAQNLSDVRSILWNFKISMTASKLNVSYVGNTWVDIDNYGTDWSLWSTWKEADSTPCNWVGVKCTPSSTVVSLDLSGWGLYQLTAESLEMLSNLTDLRELDFSWNNFGIGSPHTIPETIQTLAGLELLNFQYNSFTGPIPANISACRNLKYISIEGNQLSGNLQSLGGLANLQVLVLRNNRFTGPFPKELGEISSLVNLDLSGNRLNGTIPNLPNLTSLLNLALSYNMFTGFEGPLFPATTSLEHLSLGGNQLEGSIPSGIGNLPSLRDLDLSLNKFSGNIPAELLQLNSTTYSVTMNLSNNFLSGNIPLNGTNPCRYSYIDLSNNSLTGQIPSINNNTQIYQLLLQSNLLSGDIVDFLADSPGLAHMVELWLGNNSFSGDLSTIVNINTSFEYLRVLDLSNNNLQMSSTEGIPNPFRATLDFFSVGGVLQEFSVGGNNFSGISLPSNIGTYSALQILDFSDSHLTGQISGAAFNSTSLPNLQYFNLSNNELTGPIPATVLTLPDLITLDVTDNKLSGQLPYVPPNTALYNPNFYANNSGLCGGPLPPCPQDRGVQWWEWLIVAGSVTVALGSFLVATWRWRVYHKRHRQDADLIKTLMERESTTLMSLRELKKATQNFAEDAQIGEGGFGTVYTGKLNNGSIVAIKRSKHEGSEKDKQQFLNEVRILSQVNHRNLVKLLGCCMENKIALLVFEFVANGTLQEHLRGKFEGFHLSWKQRVIIAVQTAEALHYLHSAAMFPIYHRDVKSANILLDENLNAKVSDFGISRLAPLHATHVSTIEIKGTLGYIDPDYYTSFQLTDKSDVYSYGVVLLELISAKPAIDFDRGVEGTGLVTFATPQIERGDLQQLIDPTLRETYNEPSGNGRESILNVGRLAMLCVDKEPKARPSMKEVWKELQTVWLDFDGTSRSLRSRNEVDEEGQLFQILL